MPMRCNAVGISLIAPPGPTSIFVIEMPTSNAHLSATRASIRKETCYYNIHSIAVKNPHDSTYITHTYTCASNSSAGDSSDLFAHIFPINSGDTSVLKCLQIDSISATRPYEAIRIPACLYEPFSN